MASMDRQEDTTHRRSACTLLPENYGLSATETGEEELASAQRERSSRVSACLDVLPKHVRVTSAS